jgi:intein/homing endonuclease
MAITEKLSQEDLAFLEIVEDPVWFTEFLRSTNDGDMNTESHKQWKYRDYQKQFLTDLTTYKSLVGGRAIGKCQRGSDRIYVVDEGYVPIEELVYRTSCYVYAIDHEMRIQKAKAQVVLDNQSKIFEITTGSGYSIGVTGNHPLYTPEGWREAKEIQPGMQVAVINRLPFDNERSMFLWHELRLLGYLYFIGMRPSTKITPAFQRIYDEIVAIAKVLPQRVITPIDQTEIEFVPYIGTYKSPMTTLNRQLQKRKFGYFYRLPELLKKESNSNIRVFLEGLLAQYGKFKVHEIRIPVKLLNPPQKLNGRPLWRSHFHAEKTARDLQELFLRFGIRFTIYGTKEDDNVELVTDHENAFNLLSTFTIPGVNVGKLKAPVGREKINSHLFFDTVVSNEIYSQQSPAYAVYVQNYNTYISENFLSHNTVLLEDQKIFEITNADKEFPDVQESVLVTANQAQLTPLLNKLITRYSSSRLLKDFLKGRVNKADGTMLFETERDRPFTMFFRIAGKTPEQNMVGLHVDRIDIDESQLFPPAAFTQLLPAFNH